MDTLCDGEAPEKLPAKAVLVPHAGLVYSGRTACAVYKRVNIPERVILLGPNHTGFGPDVSVYRDGSWETPLGEVRVDRELVEEILRHPIADADKSAHLYEHSLEVQLPFLIRYASASFSITPIVMKFLNYDRAQSFGVFLGNLLRDKRALIVISSDMSHYVTARRAEEKDRILISSMERLLSEELYFKRIQYNISMCGFIPAVVGIEAVRVMGAQTGVLIDYSHSGEVTGDEENVVAYAGMVFV
jgi:AmmeMemoRadiSam system protein B